MPDYLITFRVQLKIKNLEKKTFLLIPTCVCCLLPFLEEQARYAGESAVRLSAARALSRIGTPVAMDTLRDVAQSESDEKIQSYMINWSQEQQ